MTNSLAVRDDAVTEFLAAGQPSSWRAGRRTKNDSQTEPRGWDEPRDHACHMTWERLFLSKAGFPLGIPGLCSLFLSRWERKEEPWPEPWPFSFKLWPPLEGTVCHKSTLSTFSLSSLPFSWGEGAGGRGGCMGSWSRERKGRGSSAGNSCRRCIA